MWPPAVSSPSAPFTSHPSQVPAAPLIRHGSAAPPSPQGEGKRAATQGRPYKINGRASWITAPSPLSTRAGPTIPTFNHARRGGPMWPPAVSFPTRAPQTARRGVQNPPLSNPLHFVIISKWKGVCAPPKMTKSERSHMNTRYDVAILGCGEAGIFAGYELMHHAPGLKVVALDQGGRHLHPQLPHRGGQGEGVHPLQGVRHHVRLRRRGRLLRREVQLHHRLRRLAHRLYAQGRGHVPHRLRGLHQHEARGHRQGLFHRHPRRRALEKRALEHDRTCSRPGASTWARRTT